MKACFISSVTVRGHAVTRGIIAAAVERPIVDTELAADQSRGLMVACLGAAQGNVGFACAEVAHDLRRVELDQDRRDEARAAREATERGGVIA